MDVKEAIARIEEHMKKHRIGFYPHVRIGVALDMALEALREKSYEPLTLQQLLDRPLQPVWIKEGDKGWWDIFDSVVTKHGQKPYIMTAYSETFLLEDYGNTWVAYLNNPESQSSQIYRKCPFCGSTNTTKELINTICSCGSKYYYHLGTWMNRITGETRKGLEDDNNES